MSIWATRVEKIRTGNLGQNYAFRRILVAIDGSANAGRASKAALAICSKFGAELKVIQVIPRPSESSGLNVRHGPLLKDYYGEATKEAEKNIQNVVEMATRQGVKVTGEVLDYPSSIVQAILGYAEDRRVGLIVVGTRGLGGFKKLIMGSVSTALVNHATCPVLVVR